MKADEARTLSCSYQARRIRAQLKEIHGAIERAADRGEFTITRVVVGEPDTIDCEVIHQLVADGFDAFFERGRIHVNWLATSTARYRIYLHEHRAFGRGRPAVAAGWLEDKKGTAPYAMSRTSHKERAMLFSRADILKEIPVLQSLGYPFSCEPPVYLITKV